MEFMIGEIIRFKNPEYLSKVAIGGDYVGVMGRIYKKDNLSALDGRTALFPDGKKYWIELLSNMSEARKRVPTDTDILLYHFWIGAHGIERVADVQLEIF